MPGLWCIKIPKEIRAVCAKALGRVMDLKDKAMEAAEIVKESAEDLLAEADAQRKAAASGA
ncbi:MAG: hypothetical protein LBD20_00515 [Spirochaetaceae bacterium]|nr:hypothetical protein [Spirochaetaceae bacterium]